MDERLKNEKAPESCDSGLFQWHGKHLNIFREAVRLFVYPADDCQLRIGKVNLRGVFVGIVFILEFRIKERI